MDRKLVEDLVGKPFVDGARGTDTYDCWGLAMEAMKRYGYKLPDFVVAAYDIAKVNELILDERRAWTALKEPQAGCVIVMRFGCQGFINHIGVALDNMYMLHTREKTGSVIEKFTTPVFKPLIRGFYLPPEAYKL